MPKKVTWKKGMKLTAEVFNAMDASIGDVVKLAAQIGAAGRYGLFTTAEPFEISVNVGSGLLEVVALSCHGITKSGRIIDIEFDSNYTNTFDTRLQIPEGKEAEAYLLVVRQSADHWREYDELRSEAAYTFELIGENSVVDSDCLPVGRLVNQYGWRMDETGFVPPCLYVSSHAKFMEQCVRAARLASELSDKCLAAKDSVAKTLLAHLWPTTLDVWSRLDKQKGALTPEELYSAVQQMVGSFFIGCMMDVHLELSDKDTYVKYIHKKYDGRHIYEDIEEGLGLCGDIVLKMTDISQMVPVAPVAPERPAPVVKPQPAPEPKPTPRNRWEGIEI